MPDQSVNSVGHFTVVGSFLFSFFFWAWKGVRLLGKNVVAETKADEETDPQPWWVHSFSEKGKKFFFPSRHTLVHMFLLAIHNMLTALHFSRFSVCDLAITGER